jgi:hypothetical protein
VQSNAIESVAVIFCSTRGFYHITLSATRPLSTAKSHSNNLPQATTTKIFVIPQNAVNDSISFFSIS